MTDQALRETVIRLAQPVVHSLGLLVWGVEIARAGRTLVRLFVDVPTAPQADEHQAAPGGAAVLSAAGVSDGFAHTEPRLGGEEYFAELHFGECVFHMESMVSRFRARGKKKERMNSSAPNRITENAVSVSRAVPDDA